MVGAMLRRMELCHMRYFVAVAEALSFTKAAEMLQLAQPSLTRQIRNLEEKKGRAVARPLQQSSGAHGRRQAVSVRLEESPRDVRRKRRHRAADEARRKLRPHPTGSLPKEPQRDKLHELVS